MHLIISAKKPSPKLLPQNQIIQYTETAMGFAKSVQFEIVVWGNIY